MGRKSKFSKSQIEWLTIRITRFRDAQDADNTPAFFSSVYEEFFVAYPVPKEVTDDKRKAYTEKLTKVRAT